MPFDELDDQEQSGGQTPSGGQPEQQEMTLDQFEDHYAKVFKIPKYLRQAMKEQESGADDTKALSKKGAVGRWQVMPDTAAKYGLDTNDPFDNAYAGMRYLREKYDQVDSKITEPGARWQAALAGYHGGERQINHINKTGEIAPGNDGNIETGNYADNIMRRWQQLSSGDHSTGLNKVEMGAGDTMDLGTGKITKPAPAQPATKPKDVLDGVPVDPSNPFEFRAPLAKLPAEQPSRLPGGPIRADVFAGGTPPQNLQTPQRARLERPTRQLEQPSPFDFRGPLAQVPEGMGQGPQPGATVKVDVGQPANVAPTSLRVMREDARARELARAKAPHDHSGPTWRDLPQETRNMLENPQAAAALTPDARDYLESLRAADAQAQAAYERDTDIQNAPWYPEQLANRAARGFSGTIDSSVKGLSLLHPDIENRLRQSFIMGTTEEDQQILRRRFPVDPTDDSYLAKAAEAAGSAVPFAATSAMGGFLGFPEFLIPSVMGAASNAGQTYDEAIAAGQNPDQAKRAAVIGAFIGLSEGFGVGSLGAPAEHAATHGLLRSIGDEAMEEFLQEGFSQVMNNINAKELSGYDTKRAITEGVAESALLGGLVGGGFGGAHHVVGAAAGSLADRADRQAGARAVQNEGFAPLNLTPTTMGPTQLTSLRQAAQPEYRKRLQEAAAPAQAQTQGAEAAAAAGATPAAESAPAAPLTGRARLDAAVQRLQSLQQPKKGEKPTTAQTLADLETKGQQLATFAIQRADADPDTANLALSQSIGHYQRAINTLKGSPEYQAELMSIAGGQAAETPLRDKMLELDKTLKGLQSFSERDARAEADRVKAQKEAEKKAAQDEKERKAAEVKAQREADERARVDARNKKVADAERNRAEQEAKRNAAEAQKTLDRRQAEESRIRERDEAERAKADQASTREAEGEIRRMRLFDESNAAADRAAADSRSREESGDYSGAIGALRTQQDALQTALRYLPQTPEAVKTRAAHVERIQEIANRIPDLRRRAAAAPQNLRRFPAGAGVGTENGPESRLFRSVTNPEGGVPQTESGYSPGAGFERLAEKSRGPVEDQTSLLTAIRRMGGISDDGDTSGELRRIGLKEAGTTGLARRDGHSPDTMREMLASEGYLPKDSTVSDMYDAIEGELRGRGSSRESSEEDLSRHYEEEAEREKALGDIDLRLRTGEIDQFDATRERNKLVRPQYTPAETGTEPIESYSRSPHLAGGTIELDGATYLVRNEQGDVLGANANKMAAVRNAEDRASGSGDFAINEEGRSVYAPQSEEKNVTPRLVRPTERESVPKATAENIDELRRRRDVLSRLRADRGGEMSDDLEDEYKELGAQIIPYEDSQRTPEEKRALEQAPPWADTRPWRPPTRKETLRAVETAEREVDEEIAEAVESADPEEAELLENAAQLVDGLLGRVNADVDTAELLELAIGGDADAEATLTRYAERKLNAGADAVRDLIEAGRSERERERTAERPDERPDERRDERPGAEERESESRDETGAPVAAPEERPQEPGAPSRPASAQTLDLLSVDPATVAVADFDTYLGSLEQLRNDQLVGKVELEDWANRQLRAKLKRANEVRVKLRKEGKLGPKNPPRQGKQKQLKKDELGRRLMAEQGLGARLEEAIAGYGRGLVSISDLRSQFPDVGKEAFDREIGKLHDQQRVALHEHDWPAGMTEDARNALVERPARDARTGQPGKAYYNGVTLREGVKPGEEVKPKEGPTLYHGSHEALTALGVRTPKTFDSFGTWFTSDPELAGHYGANVYESKLPADLNLIEYEGNGQTGDPTADINRKILASPDVARRSGFEKEAAILEKTQPDTPRLNELTRKLEHSGQPLTPAEQKELRQLREAADASRTLGKSQRYMQTLRQQTEAAGYDGIVWRNVMYDVSDRPHDVYVIFNKEDLPVTKRQAAAPKAKPVEAAKPAAAAEMTPEEMIAEDERREVARVKRIDDFINDHNETPFQAPLRDGKSLIVHRSVKPEYKDKWQVTWLDKDGEPFRDTAFKDFRETLDELTRFYGLDLDQASVAPAAQAQPQASAPAEFGAENKVFTRDRADKARDLLKKKFAEMSRQTNAGVPIDPEMIQAGVDLVGYYVEGGARTFADLTKRIIGDLGESARPYVKSWYLAVRNYPGFDKSGMESEADLDRLESGEEQPTLTHRDPELDRKPILAETKDGRKIVANPANESGVSVVKDRSEDMGGYSSSSTQVDLPKDIADQVVAFGKKIPDSALTGDGREKRPHVTILYGLHGFDPKFVQAALEGERPVKVTFGKVSLFENDERDVVKVDVTSPDLHRLYAKVLKSQPNTQTFPEYKPHATIAYVRKGQGAKYVGDNFLEGKSITLDKVVFSGRDGEETEIQLNGKPAEQLDETQAAEPVEAPAEQPAARDYGTPAEPNIPDLAAAFSEKFAKGEGFRTTAEARAYAAELLGGEVGAGSPAAKQIDEAVELGAVRAGRDLAAKGLSSAETYAGMLKILDAQPTLNERTSTSIANQAFSTPVPLAFAAQQLAGVDEKTTVYEPTAGNGALVMAAKPENITANELNPERAANLRESIDAAEVSNADATQFDPGKKFDVVIANPPFGPVRTENGSKRFQTPFGETTEIDHAIAFKALESMKDDGSAVLIVGGISPLAKSEEARSDAYNTSAKRRFYFYLYQNYNVVDHFTAAGSMYKKQGAGWPVDVIVIKGRGKSGLELPAVEVPRIISNYDELGNLIENPRQPAARPASNRVLESGERGARSDQGGGRHADQPRGLRRPSVSTAGGEAQAGGKSGASPGGRPRTTPKLVREPNLFEDADRVDSGKPADTGETQLPAREPAQGLPDETRSGPAAAAGGLRTDQSAPVGGRTDVGARRTPVVAETESHSPYKPLSKANSLNVAVPRNMSGATEKALSDFEERHGSPDEYLAEKLGYDVKDIPKYFGAEQVDAVALAVSNIEAGKGFVIGDQTGIGKGRTNAAIIRYAIKNGKTPIFVTQKPALYADMIRDLSDIGMPNARVLITNGGESIPLNDAGTEWMQAVKDAKDKDQKAPPKPSDAKVFRAKPDHDQMLERLAQSGKLAGYDVVFTTYDQMNPQGGKFDRPRHGAVSRLGDGGVVILDESHTAGGTEPGARSNPNQQTRSKFFRQLVNKAGSVFYSSATYAKRPDVMDLYSKTDLGQLGGNKTSLADLFHRGGVALQQVVASKLAEAGQYLRRERTFDGIRYDPQVVKVEKEQAEHVSRAMAVIAAFDEAKKGAIKALDKEAKREGKSLSGDGSTGSAGADSTNFTSLMHNVVDQMLLGLKAEPAAQQAIEAIKRGEKPVLTVSNTMESFLKEAGLSPGDPVDLSFRDILLRYLNRSRDVTIRDRDGKRSRRPLSDDELARGGALSAFEAAEDFIRDADFADIPISPIDYVRQKIQAAGYSVDEITGRGTQVDYTGKMPILKARSSADTKVAGRRRVIQQFNNGKLDALILNQAGSTGISLHASEKVEDKNVRHMIIWQPEKNIDTHMQMLGRVNRTGQVVVPRYTQMIADVPAEKRPAAVLLKKMASLNANTTASRKSAVQTEGVTDFMNELGDEVIARLMATEGDIHRKLGSPLDYDGDSMASAEAARRVTGRIPLLPIAEQEALYDRIEQEYKDYLEQRDAMGDNPLEAKTMDFRAETLKKDLLVEGTPGSPFSEPAYLERVKIQVPVKPYTQAEVMGMLRDNLGLGESAELGELQQAGKRQVKELRDQVRARVDDFKDNMASEYDSDATLQAQRQKADQTFLRWNAIANLVTPGSTVTVETPSGSVSGVVISLQERGKPKNPAAFGAWQARLAVLDGRELRFSFNDLVDKGGQPRVKFTDEVQRFNQETGLFEYRPMLPEFDDSQGLKKQTRYMVTGNIVSGYSKIPKGQILNYTDADGVVRQGVLMPANFDADKAMQEMPVEFKSADHVLQFIDKSGAVTLSDPQPAFRISRGKNGKVLMAASGQKANAGKIILSPALRDMGIEFSGNRTRMTAQMDQETARRAIWGILSGEVTGEPETLQAENLRDVAKGIVSSGSGPARERSRDWQTKSVAMAESLADIAENTRIRVPKSPSRANMIYGNEQAHAWVDKADTRIHGVREPFNGMNLSKQEAKQMAEEIRREKYWWRDEAPDVKRRADAAIDKLADAFDNAADKFDRVIYVRAQGRGFRNLRGTVYHELTHNAERTYRSVKGWFAAQPVFEKIKAALEDKGYKPHEMISESVAHILGGQRRQLGLSLKEAVDYLDSYFANISFANGRESVNSFNPMNAAPEMRQALREAKEKHGPREPVRIDEEAIQRAIRRRSGGDGESGERDRPLRRPQPGEGGLADAGQRRLERPTGVARERVAADEDDELTPHEKLVEDFGKDRDYISDFFYDDLPGKFDPKKLITDQSRAIWDAYHKRLSDFVEDFSGQPAKMAAQIKAAQAELSQGESEYQRLNDRYYALPEDSAEEAEVMEKMEALEASNAQLEEKIDYLQDEHGYLKNDVREFKRLVERNTRYDEADIESDLGREANHKIFQIENERDDAMRKALSDLQNPPASKPDFVVEAEQRLREAAAGQLAGSGTRQLADLAIVTGWRVYEKGMSFAQWAREVVANHGDKIRPYLQGAWRKVRSAKADQKVGRSIERLSDEYDSLTDRQGDLRKAMFGHADAVEAATNERYSIDEDVRRLNEQLKNSVANTRAAQAAIRRLAIDSESPEITKEKARLDRQIVEGRKNIERLKARLDRIRDERDHIGDELETFEAWDQPRLDPKMEDWAKRVSEIRKERHAEQAKKRPPGTYMGAGFGSLQALFDSKPAPKTTPLREVVNKLGHEPLGVDPAQVAKATQEQFIEALSKGKNGTLPGARAQYWAEKLGAKKTADRLAEKQAKFIEDGVDLVAKIADATERMAKAQRGSAEYEKAKSDQDRARIKLANQFSKAGEYTHPFDYAAKAYKASLLSALHIPYFNIVAQVAQFPFHEAQKAADWLVPQSVFKKWGIPYEKQLSADVRTWGPAMWRELGALKKGAGSIFGDVADMMYYGTTTLGQNVEMAGEVHKKRMAAKQGEREKITGGTDKYELGNRPKMIPGVDQALMTVGRVQGAADVPFFNVMFATALAAEADATAKKIARENPELEFTAEEVKALARDLAHEPSPAMIVHAADEANRFKLDYPTWGYEQLQKLRNSERIKQGGRHVEAAWKAALDFVVPFSKIPLAAVDMALFRYSPVGFGRVGSRLVKAGRELNEAKRTAERQGRKLGATEGRQSEAFARDTAELYRQAIVGSISWAALGLLGALGYASFTGGDDDKDRKGAAAKEALGEKYTPEMIVGDYAVDVGKLGPVGQAAALGGRIAAASRRRYEEKREDYEPESKRLDRTFGAIGKGAFLDNPLGQGAKDVIDAFDSGSPGAGAAKFLGGKAGAIVPGALRDVAKMTTPTKVMPDDNSGLGRIRGDLRSAVPSLRAQMQPRLDALGRPVDQPNPFAFVRSLRHNDQVEDTLRVGSGLPKPARDQGEPAAEYNRRLQRNAGNLNDTMRSLRRDPEMQTASPLARRAIYEQAFNSKQMERAGKLSEESVQAERHIEGLKADAFAALAGSAEYQALNEKDKAAARKLITEELKRYRARVGSVDRAGRPRAEKPAEIPDWTPGNLARAALQNLRAGR
jgi:hypothetical protein